MAAYVRHRLVAARHRGREALLVPGLTLAGFALALAQRPGLASSDTKINLHVDPAGFLAEVASVWSDSGGLGQVQAGQYAGYLFPMGPFFALGHALGLSPWLVHRLWLGALLAIAAWGSVRLLDAVRPGPRGVAHLAAGVLLLLNPYVVVFANRTSVTLLAYAALPWLLLAVHRGVRSAGGWWWPAAFALIVAATGGGVNAAVTALALLGPVLLLGHEVWWGAVSWRDAGRFAARTAVLSVVASSWWIVPVAAHARYGLNFLPFTESAGAIWDTTSLSETFRLMGYWISYLGVGFGERLSPYFSTTGPLLFDPVARTATFLVPALVLGGFALTRRWHHGPFFLAMTLMGLLVMAAGFPPGAPLRRALTLAYNEVEAVQFLRTTYKAGPLVAVGMACLGGAAAGEAWERLSGRPRLRGALGGLALLTVAAAAWPLTSGRAVDAQVTWDRIPPAWTAAGRDLDRELPVNSRALVLPGQLFAFYRWGATVDPILPAVTGRPVSAFAVPPYSDLHAADLLWTVDSLVQQRRLIPGQLPRLLDLMGVGAVVTGTDDDVERSGAMAPADAAAELERAGGLGAPARSYGTPERFAPTSVGLDAPRLLPQVRRYDRPGGAGLVRVEPLGPLTVVDGSAEALAGLAAFGALPAGRPLAYAGDRTEANLRGIAGAGAELVVSDTNRRRVLVSSRTRQSRGATLDPEAPISEDAAVLDPFGRGSAAQTVATYSGARWVRSPFSPGFPQFPEHRAYAAFDGSPDTYWLADRYLQRPRRWVEVGFPARRDVGHVDVLAQRESGTVVTAVEVDGRRHPIRPGWNRLRVGLRRVDRLRVGIASVRKPSGRLSGAGGLAEVRVPGLRVRERLRPPRLLERALSGSRLERSALTYLFARRSGDDPFRRARDVDPDRGLVKRDRNIEAALVARPGDEEIELARELDLPASRSFTADAWVSVAPEAADDALDRLAGYSGRMRFLSSGRFEGRPQWRASGAFDGDLATAWVGERVGRRPPWLAVEAPRELVVRRLRLGAARGGAAFPTVVRLRHGPGRGVMASGDSGRLRVGPGGVVVLPRAVRAHALRLEVLEAQAPRGGREGAVAIGELRLGGIAPARIPRSGTLRVRCGAVRVRVGGSVVRMAPGGTVAELDAGRPLRARGCARPVTLGRGRRLLETVPGLFRTELLRLRSPALLPGESPPGGGRVTDPGRPGPGRYDGIRVALDGPSWLVLAESFNRGWRAFCDGRSLGRPVVADGFANGWPAPAGCREVRLAFAANRAATLSYAVGGLACALLLGLLVVRRPPRPAAARDRSENHAEPPKPKPWPLRPALRAGGVVGLACCFLFAIRAGLLIGPAVALILWRGVGARALALAAAALIGVVVPVLHLVRPVEDLGGFNTEFARGQIAAHWLAVAAFVLLAAALWRSLAGSRDQAQ